MIDVQETRTILRSAFLEGMSRMASSVCVVTTDGPAGRGGVTVSAMTSISADGEDPTLLTCLNASASVLPLVLANGCFCINVLRTGQTEISDIFSARRPAPGGDKFNAVTTATLVTGAPHLIDLVNRLRGAFNVSVSGQKAAIAALGDQDFVAASREHNAAERERVAAAIAMLGNHGISASPSEANFLLVHFEGAVTAAQALDALAEAGYAVRHLPGQGLPNSLRITIGKSEDMSHVIACLRTLCGEAA